MQVRPGASALMGDGSSHIGEEGGRCSMCEPMNQARGDARWLPYWREEEGVTCCELPQAGCVHQRPGCEIDANLMGHWGPGPGIVDLGGHFFRLLAAIDI